MKTFLFFLLSIFSPVWSEAASFFVRPAQSGSHSGADWNNAFGLTSINWGSLRSGDTIYIAGGTYSGTCNIGAAGVTLLRVKSSDAAATSAAGWQSGFDSTVTWNVAKGNRGLGITGPSGDGTTVDGRQDGGIVINISDSSSGVEFYSTAPKNVTLKYLKVWGPGKITQTGDVRQMDLTPSGGSMSNLKVQNCELGGGGDSAMYLLTGDNVLIENCSFHDADAVNAAQFHQNLIYCGTIKNSTFRQNRFFNIQVEALFFGDPGNSNINVYSNLFYQGSIPKNSGRGIEFDHGSSGNSNIQVVGNTFVDLPIGVQLGGPATFSGSRFANNINWRCSVNLATGWSSVTNYSGAADPFLDSSAFDYRLSSNSPAKGAGTNLGSPYDVSFTGELRTAPWDIGAYAAKSGGGGPTPTPTATPGPTSTPQPTATPTPQPTSTPSPVPPVYHIGDWVTPTELINVRATPAGAVLGTHVPGDKGQIKAGPTHAPLGSEDVIWWDIDWLTTPHGWSGEDVLSSATTPQPTPTPPGPTPTPTPGVPTYENWIKQQNEWIRANPPVAD